MDKLRLTQFIVAQIKARIHSEITLKISTSVTSNVIRRISIDLITPHSISKVEKASSSTIQLSVANGLQEELMPTKLDRMSQLKSVMIQAEKLVRLHLTKILPKIEKALRSCIETHLERNTHHLEIYIPKEGNFIVLLHLDVSVLSRAETITRSVFRNYIRQNATDLALSSINLGQGNFLYKDSTVTFAY
ncbi:hypothetical protein G6F64_002503 [Rhizopus arrhizus]|uniref:Uncharacterized protein n=1 Tax=Rhizopus oryzae TaxID=64495 RepID=A0A9P6XG51_RHIOR|nr:hypothetical protein G6F64_002503 [Rhizopus arrhizus]